MKQTGLFAGSKQMNKDLIAKMTSPKRSRSSVVAGQAGAGISNSIAKRVAVAESSAVELLVEMLEQQKGYEMELVTDPIRLNEYITKAIEYGSVGYDTEGSGLDPIDDYVCGFSLYFPGEKAIYVPFWHTDLQSNVIEGQMKFEDVQQEMERFSEASYHGLKVIYGNAKYDMRIGYTTLGYFIKPYWDVILASMFLNENEPSGLKFLWDKYVYRNAIPKKLKTFDKLFDKLGFNWFDPKKVYVYAANDALMTYQVYLFQKDFLEPGGKHVESQNLSDTSNLFLNIEMQIIQHLAEMEDLGVTIDTELAEKLKVDYETRLAATTEEADKMLAAFDLSKLPLEVRSKLTNPINVGSPAQVAIILYDVVGLKQIEKRGTGEGILTQLIELYPEHKNFLNKILEYRGLRKILSTYIINIPLLVKDKTGRLHTNFRQYGAKTGRQSSKDPNLQNIPARNRDIRPMFIASENQYLISGDYSQQEPRVLAHLSNDPALIQAYKDGKDLYSWIGSTVYQLPYDQCTEFHPVTKEFQPKGDQVREEMKSIVLGAMYGRGAGAVAEQLETTFSEAQEIIQTFFNNFPGVKEYIDERQAFCISNGYVTTAYGRKRRLPDIQLPEFEVLDNKTKQPIEDKMVEQHIQQQMSQARTRNDKWDIRNYWKKEGLEVKDNGGFIAEAKRQVINSEVQGTAADITKKAMLEVGNDKVLKDLGFKMLLTVHDEIIGEAPIENALEASKRMAEVMIHACSDVISVPMEVDMEIMQKWFGEDKTAELVK